MRQQPGDQPNARWNFLTLGSDVALFSLGLGITSPYIILPLFVHRLTPENWPVSLIQALRMGAQLLPPLFIAGIAERRQRQKPLILWLTLLERLPYLVLALGVVWLAQGHDTWLLVLFFVMITAQSLGGGLTFSPWLDFVSRAVPDRLRGRFFGWWIGAGNALSIGGTALAASLIVWVAWPWNFATAFGLSFVMVTISFILLALGREPPRTAIHAPPRPSGSAALRLRHWAGDLRGLVRGDRNFAAYLVVNALSGLATLGTGLVAVAALNQAHLSVPAVALEGTVFQICSTLGYFTWGWIADRFGHRLILICGAAASAGAMLAALFARGFSTATVAFMLLGLGLSGIQLAQLSYVVEFGTAARRPLYIGMAYLLLAPFAAGAPLLGGILADRFGYTPVFGASAVFGALTALGYWLIVRDPRPLAPPLPSLATGEE